MKALKGAQKKKARNTKSAPSSIMPLEDVAPSATMTFPISENMITTSNNKRKRSEESTPEASKSHNLEVSSKKKGNQTNSNSGHSKLSRSGSN